MGIAELVTEITATGEAEARRIREAADKEASDGLREAATAAAKVTDRWTARAREEAEATSRRLIASAQLEAKKLRLRAEADVLNAVRDAARDRIAKLSAQERAQYTKALVKAAHGTSGGRAWARADDKALVQELGLEGAGEIAGLGGIIVEDASGETREDLRFETVLDEAWRATVREVASELFGA